MRVGVPGAFPEGRGLPPFPPPATHVVCGMVMRAEYWGEGGDLVVCDVEVDAAIMKVLLPARAISPNHSPTPFVGRMAGGRECWGGAMEVEGGLDAAKEEAEAPREFVGSREAEEDEEAEARREAELATAAWRRNCVDGGSGGGSINCERARDGVRGRDQLCRTPPFFDPRKPHPWG